MYLTSKPSVFYRTVWLLLSLALLSGCAFRLYEAVPNTDSALATEPWYVHCETTVSHAADPEKMPGVRGEKWLQANDATGQPITLTGRLEAGFFSFEGVSQGDFAKVGRIGMPDLRRACLAMMVANKFGKANELAAVRVFRKSDGVNISIDFGPRQRQPGIRKFVIFGDSLSDSGKLKERLRVLPGSPYWAGRFSNGPNWIDYLEAWSEFPVQNHSFGGASVTGPENISRQNLYALLHDGGQYFVSGSIDHQIDDYEKGYLGNAAFTQPQETAFIVWTGSNDYISKEPFSGAIDTLLNHPLEEGGYQAVVDAVIAASYRQLERIYALGARYILVANLPDLGDTPIILQNQTYTYTQSGVSDDLRRLTMAARLRELSSYHNDQLALVVEKFKENKPDAHIEQFDADFAFSALLRGELPEGLVDEVVDPEFSIEAQGRLVQHAKSRERFQDRCYRGGYIGSSKASNICDAPARVIFWDVIHPSTYAHCWTAYLFGQQMSRAGWMASPPPAAQYRAWCQGISQIMLGHDQVEDVLSLEGLPPRSIADTNARVTAAAKKNK